MINGRTLVLLQSILKGNRTLKELSKNWNINERTIRYEIEKINEYLLNKYNKNMVKISKGKIEIYGKDIIEKLLEENYNIKYFSSKEREKYIFLNILLERGINQQKMCEKLDISRNTSKLYLKNLEENLKKYHLKLENSYKKGIILKGEEENIRHALLNFFWNLKNCENNLFKEKMDKFLEENDEGIESFLNYCQKKMEKIVSDEAYEIIKIYLKIMILMIKKNKSIEKIKNEHFLETTKEYQNIKKGVAILESEYDIEISTKEALKITDLFLGSHTYNFSYSYYETWIEMEILIKKMIFKFNKRIDTNIIHDKILIDGLLNHLKPTLYRIRNGIELENTVYLEVKESYPVLFQITTDIVQELENFIGKKFTYDEIAFITIHFKAAIDRNTVASKDKKRILLVCGLGYGTSKLLSQNLKEVYSVEIVDIIPKHLLKKRMKEKDFDFIVTTVDLNIPEDNRTIKVNPILSLENIEKLKNMGLKKRSKKILLSELLKIIKENGKIENKERMIENFKELIGSNLIDDISSKKLTIFDTLKKERIALGEYAKNWEEAVRISGDLLLKTGCIEKKYIDNMVNCIKIYGSYMIMGNNIAFPHAQNDGYVKKTGFSLVTLKKSVIFPGDLEVKTIIAFCSKDNREHMDSFMSILEELEKVEFNVEKFVKKL